MDEEILEQLDEISSKVDSMIQNADDEGMTYMLGSQILQKLDQIKQMLKEE